MARIEVAGKTIRLVDSCTIGRDKSCNLSIAHGSISREHARIYCEGASWYVEDLLSANGTTVNGKPVLGGPQSLSDGDAIEVGDVPVRFWFADIQATQPVQAPIPSGFDPMSLIGREFSGFKIQSFDRMEVTGPLFRARHARTERDVELWVFDSEITRTEGGEFVNRFRDLISVLAGMRHPDMVRVYQLGQEQDLLWYATEIPGGPTLAQLVHQGFAPLRAVEAVVRLCRLLAVFHEAGLVHGDIKPSLVHMDESGRVRLGSLGLAGLNSANRRRLQAAAATRQVFYLDPEQARSGDCNVKSDIYSAGCILVQLLTGRPPYIGDNYEAVLKAHATEPIPQLASQLDLPPVLDGIVAGMLAKEHMNRYNDLKPVLAELDALRTAIANKPQGAGRRLADAVRWLTKK